MKRILRDSSLWKALTSRLRADPSASAEKLQCQLRELRFWLWLSGVAIPVLAPWWHLTPIDTGDWIDWIGFVGDILAFLFGLLCYRGIRTRLDKAQRATKDDAHP